MRITLHTSNNLDLAPRPDHFCHLKSEKLCSSPPVSIAAMPNTKDAHRIVPQCEQHSVITKPQPEGTSHVAVKRHNLSTTRARKMQDTFEDAHRRSLIQSANVPPGFVEPLNPVPRHLFFWSGGKILWLESKLSQDLLHRNTFAAMLREPGLTLVKAAPIFIRYRFVISRNHGFEETANSDNLARGKTVDQFVNLLFLLSDVAWHTASVHSTARASPDNLPSPASGSPCTSRTTATVHASRSHPPMSS